MTPSFEHQNSSKANQRKHWLCIAYAFAPMQRSGTHRTLAFVKHLDELGWDATVLTVKPNGETVDDSLMDSVPASTTIVRTRWIHPIAAIKKLLSKCTWPIRKISSPTTDHRQTNDKISHPANGWMNKLKHAARVVKEWVSRLMMIPDSRIGWIPFAVFSGYRAIKKQPPEIIYSTSPYMSAHLIAMILSGLLRIPWIADFRDPWGGNPYRNLRFASLKGWDSFLERLVLKNASRIVCNTPTMQALLCRRHRFVAKKCSTILNGFDSDRLADIQPIRVAPLDECVLTHCGQFYGRRSPQVWFDALKLAIDQRPNHRGNIKLQLLGHDHYEGKSLMQLADSAGVAHHVIIAGPKSHTETLSLMAGSDALILAGYDGIGGDLQVPHKLFEYLAVGKPIIAGIANKNPSIDILKNANAPALICDPNNAATIAKAMGMVADGKLDNFKNAFSGAHQYDRKHRAGELEKLFQQLCSQDLPEQHLGMVSAARSFVGRFRGKTKSVIPPPKDVVSSGVASSPTTSRTF